MYTFQLGHWSDVTNLTTLPCCIEFVDERCVGCRYGRGLTDEHLAVLNATGDELFYRLAGAMGAVIRQVKAKSEGDYSVRKIEMVESSAQVQAAAAESLSNEANASSGDTNITDTSSTDTKVPTIDIGVDGLKKEPKPGLKGFLNKSSAAGYLEHADNYDLCINIDHM